MENHKQEIEIVSGEAARSDNQMFTRRNFLYTSIFGATALGLAACGDSTPTSVSAPSTTVAPTTTISAASSSAVSTPAGAASKPKTGGTLTTATFGDPPHFDIHLSGNVSRYHLQALTYSGLVRPKMGTGANPTNPEVEPDLAESWEQTNPTTYTFRLRKGVKWHDGIDFTSADVKYSIERIMENKPGRERRFLFEPVDRIETPDPLTVVFTLKYAYSPFLAYLTSIDAMIAPKHIPGDDLKEKIVGTGPFTYDAQASVKGNKYVLKKNPNYFLAGRPYLDGVVLVVQPDVSTQIAGLRSGQLDVQYTPYTKANMGNLEQVKTLQLQRFLSLLNNQIHFNVTRKPFDDVRVRRALTMALDRQSMIEVVWGGEGQAEGPVPAALKEWAAENPLTDLPYLKRDVEGAKKLLAEAGFPNGFSTSMVFGAPYAQQVSLAQLANAQWKEIGVNVELKGVDGPTWGRTLTEKNFDTMSVSFVTFEEVDFYVYGFYYPGAGRNTGNWEDKDITALLEKQRQTLDKTERKKVLLDLQKKLAEQAWVAYGTTGYSYGVIQTYVRNYQANPFIHTRQFDAVWFDK